MQVITGPTIKPGEECEPLYAMLADTVDRRDARDVLSDVLQGAFEQGVGHGQGTTPLPTLSAPVAAVVRGGEKPVMPPLRTWAEIEASEPRGAIENLVYRAGLDTGLLLSMVEAAARYAAANYDG